MARTLKQLKASVERLIEEQGENAPVAAFLFTKNDVFEMDNEGNQKRYSLRMTEEVLDNLEDNDWIYEQVFNAMDDEVADIKRRDKKPEV